MNPRLFGLLCPPLIVLCSMGSFAQKTEEKAVLSTIENLFRAMETGDSALARTTFAEDVSMATILRDKANNPVIRRETEIAGFMKAIGTPHTGTWYEEIWDAKVQLDGDFAQVWCDYAFYIDKNFSHCGVDAFHLFKQNGVWKIFHLADTRRKDPCSIPKNIQEKHK
jgi:hypothetical protein